MRVKEIEYSELKVTGKFENARLGVTIEISENESPAEAVEKARSFVQAHMRDKEEGALEATTAMLELLETRRSERYSFEPGGES